MHVHVQVRTCACVGVLVYFVQVYSSQLAVAEGREGDVSVNSDSLEKGD